MTQRQREHIGAAWRGGAVRAGSARAGSGFTLIEMLMTIIILSLLLGLLFIGFRAARRATLAATDAALANSIEVGLVKFRENFGFLPPLVKDKALGTAVPLVTNNTALNQNQISVFQVSEQTGADFTTLVTLPVAPADNVFGGEKRFSTVSLAYYLAGALDWAYNAANPDVPIDGVKGNGMYAPNRDGTFVVPSSAAAPIAANRKRVGKTYEPFVSMGSAVKLVMEVRGGALAPDLVELRDSGNAPVRYYRWLNVPADPGLANAPDYAVRLGLRVPRLVGRDPTVNPFLSVSGAASYKTPDSRDVRKNVSLRSATWAIVLAGPNKAFGDEPLNELAQIFGVQAPVDAGDQVALRSLAEEDNMVRVGE